MNKDLLNRTNKQLRTWNRVAVELRIVHISLAVIGIVCPLIVASFADLLSNLQIRVLSFAAAVAIALFSAFEVGRLTTRFREAWKLLNAALLQYEANEIDENALNKAYRDGEKTIGQLKQDPFGKESTVS